jgi:hypothetical protein
MAYSFFFSLLSDIGLSHLNIYVTFLRTSYAYTVSMLFPHSLSTNSYTCFLIHGNFFSFLSFFFLSFFLPFFPSFFHFESRNFLISYSFLLVYTCNDLSLLGDSVWDMAVDTREENDTLLLLRTPQAGPRHYSDGNPVKYIEAWPIYSFSLNVWSTPSLSPDPTFFNGCDPLFTIYFLLLSTWVSTYPSWVWMPQEEEVSVPCFHSEYFVRVSVEDMEGSESTQERR